MSADLAQRTQDTKDQADWERHICLSGISDVWCIDAGQPACYDEFDNSRSDQFEDYNYEGWTVGREHDDGDEF